MIKSIKNSSIVIFSILLELLLCMGMYNCFNNYFIYLELIIRVISLLVVFYIIKESRCLSYDISFIILILLFPIMGIILYIFIGSNIYSGKRLGRINNFYNKTISKYLDNNTLRKDEIEERDNIEYLSNYYMVSNDEIKYYDSCENEYEDILKELEGAHKYIFLSFFTIGYGKMWDDILNILEYKVNDGVEVRVIYDDMGCNGYISNNYDKVLEDKGIKCVIFNKVDILGSGFRNRLHQKMIIIDGKMLFTGGFNLTDEYINLYEKYGYWKDVGVKVYGSGVWNYVVIFLSIWNSYRKDDKDFNIYRYKSNNKKGNGYSVLYSSNPLSNVNIAKDMVLNIINSAKKYLYICTPYLVIDNEVENSLLLAVKRGVDVRIIVPGIPDKKIVYEVTKSYFESLIRGGVKIYKYSPGFMHGKILISDDNIANIGSINLDYRSLYLDFECGVYIEDVDVIKDIKKDFEQCLGLSERICDVETNIFVRIFQSILRMFSIFM